MLDAGCKEPGCIYAAAQDLETIESAQLRETCFITGHSRGYDSVPVRQRGCVSWSKTANRTEAAVLVFSELECFHEGFSTSRPNNLYALLYSELT